MPHRIFLAGAAGAIGQRLIPLLIDAGHYVTGTTRSAAKAETLRALGADPMVLDVFDAEALSRALAAARPDVVIHQLTDLPPGLDPARMAEAVGRNARIRDEGTRNLVRAAIAPGATRLVAQSIAWMYAPGPEPHAEGDALDIGADGRRGITARGVAALESQVLNAPRWRGSSCATARSMAPAPAPTSPGITHRSTSMPPPMRRCSPSTGAHRERSTWRDRMRASRATKRAWNWAGTPIFVCRPGCSARRRAPAGFRRFEQSVFSRSAACADAP